MATSSRTDSQLRLNELFEAAVLLDAKDREAFIAEACGEDARLRVELLTLLACQSSLLRLDLQRRHRLSSVFHAAYGLPPASRRAFLDRACADRPDDRREIDSLLLHAADSAFLDGPAAVADETTLGPLAPATGWSGVDRGGGGREEEARPRPPADPLVGRRVRDYVILEKIGEGGMGVVYKALDTKLQKHVAVKVIRPEYTSELSYRRRLISEAQLAARLSHRNIATVYTLIEEGPDLFIVSEYVPGPSLRDEVSRGPMEYKRLLAVFLGIAQGLDAAHSKGIFHRDLKPDNVLIDEGDVPKIVDFGLAKSTQSILTTTRMLTQPGSRAGTPAYMAPEQIADSADVPLDFRCDLFAFGVTLYEAATGANPFEGRSLLTTLENIKRLTPPPLSRPGTDLGKLDAIVQRCLQKRPQDRYPSAAALAADLEQLRGSHPSRDLDDLQHDRQRRRRVWWEIHQLSVVAVHAVALTLLWFVHGLAQPLRLSQALTFLALAGGAVLIGIRLHYWFASRQEFSTLTHARRRFGPVLRWADWNFSAVFGAMAGSMLWNDRPGTAAPLLIIAVVNVVLFLVVEPESECEAFPEDGDDAHESP